VVDRWATFDCYGTLIDWDAGVRACLSSLWPDVGADALVARYHEVEPRLQLGRSVSYRQVLDESLAEIASSLGLGVPDGRGAALSDSLASWPPFAETHDVLSELGARGWRLAILSNTDPDLLAASVATIDVPIDLLITAAEAGSYKPAFGHWETFFRQSGADRARHVHVGASLFHDVEPCAKLGLPCVWIDRVGETSELPRAGRLRDLTDLPELLDGLVLV
jgi:2-haloalkanoic acid dehalogenase type II